MPVSLWPIVNIAIILLAPLIAWLRWGRKGLAWASAIVLLPNLAVCLFIAGYGWKLHGQAESGDARSQYDYARWLEVYPDLVSAWYPISLDRNIEEGLMWLSQAAEAGQPEAMWALGVRLKFGPMKFGWQPIGTEDEVAGDAWMEKAVAAGYNPQVAPQWFYWQEYRQFP